MYCFHRSRPTRHLSTAVNLRLKFSNFDENVQQSDFHRMQPGRHRYHRSKRLNRYIMSLNYWEQFSMATVNLVSLVCLGELWNATTVQPFTFNSRLYGLRNLKPGKLHLASYITVFSNIISVVQNPEPLNLIFVADEKAPLGICRLVKCLHIALLNASKFIGCAGTLMNKFTKTVNIIMEVKDYQCTTCCTTSCLP